MARGTSEHTLPQRSKLKNVFHSPRGDTLELALAFRRCLKKNLPVTFFGAVSQRLGSIPNGDGDAFANDIFLARHFAPAKRVALDVRSFAWPGKIRCRKCSGGDSR